MQPIRTYAFAPQMRTSLLIAATVLASACAPEKPTPAADPAAPVAPAAARVADSLAAVRFVPNRGQWRADVRYAVLGSTTGWLHDDGFAVRFARRARSGSSRELLAGGLPAVRGAVVRTRFSGAARGFAAGARLPGGLNFLRGDDPAAFRTGVPAHADVTMQQVLPGIDVVFRRDDGHAFAYDLLLAPGADLAAFEANCEGADELRIDRDGRLRVVVSTPDGPLELTQEPPVAWQEDRSGRRPVDVAFVLLGRRSYGFVADGLDAALPTVVDPGIAWSTYVGGGSSDSVNGLVRRPGQGIWVAGWAGSTDFPTTAGAYQATGQRDAFVAKLSDDGATLLFATYFGGSGFDEARDLDLGPGQTPTIVGFTDSPDLPVTANAYQPAYAGASPIVPIGDAFVATLSANGDALLASTYLGGAFDEVAEGVVVDAQGHAHVAGWTSSGNFPTTPGSWQPALGGPLTLQSDGFLVRLAPDAQSASYSTYVGATLNDQFYDIDLDPVSGEVVAAGWSVSANFPTTSLAYRTTSAGSVEMVVVRLAASGAGPVYSTFLGGVVEEVANGCALAPDGSVWIAGWSDSPNFPISANAPQPALGGEEDGVVCRLSADGQSLPFSTFLGGGDADQARAIGLDGADVLVVGEAGAGFPLTLDAIQPTFGGGTLDGFVTCYSGGGSTVEYSSYAGGAGQDVLGSIAFEGGLAVLGGWSFSADFPVTSGALQTQLLGAEDGVVMMLDLLTDLPGGLGVAAGAAPGRVLAAGGRHEVVHAVLTNSTPRELTVDSVRVLVAGRGLAPVQARELTVWIDDPGTPEERDHLAGGPVAVAADDSEVDVALAGVTIPSGGEVTLRVVVDFLADTSAGSVELAAAIVDPDSWTVRAFGAGGGPTVRVLGSGRAQGAVLVAGALPGDGDRDTEFTVLDLRAMCSRLGAVDPLVDADGDQTITLTDVDLTCDALLGRATVFGVPGVAPRGAWLTLQGVFHAAATVEAVLGGRSLTVGCLTPRELTVFVDPTQPTGTFDLIVNVDGHTVVAQAVLVQ